MVYYPLILVMLFAIIDWIAVEKKWKIVEYVCKPATMLALIGWIWLSAGLGGGMLWFSLGAIFCLAGDVFLMLPRDMFLFGLIAFLLGHISYIIGLNNAAPYISLVGVVVLIILAIYIGWLYPKLAAGLSAKGKKSLKIPVFLYSIVISLMVYSAIMTWNRPGWSAATSLLVSLGAILFYSSDSLLAWDRFINALPHGRLLNMVTYHLGQIGILVGAMIGVAIM